MLPKRATVFASLLAVVLMLAATSNVYSAQPLDALAQCKPELLRWLASDAAAQRQPIPRAQQDCLLADRGLRLQRDSHPRQPPTRESFAPGWKERLLPAEERGAFSDDRNTPAGVAPEWAARLPIGELLRYEQDGDRIVAVTSSIMPQLTSNSGSYWICLSHDGGRRFEAPLYTGIATEHFYTLRKRSDHPLLHRGVLRLEMWAPPSADAEPSRRRAVLLRTELKALRRDSDGDGIANNIELATTLDPHSRDSDGDGIADGVDAMPNLANTGPRSVRAAALESALLRRNPPPASTADRFTLPPADGSRPYEMAILVGEPDDSAAPGPNSA